MPVKYVTFEMTVVLKIHFGTLFTLMNHTYSLREIYHLLEVFEFWKYFIGKKCAGSKLTSLYFFNIYCSKTNFFLNKFLYESNFMNVSDFKIY